MVGSYVIKMVERDNGCGEIPSAWGRNKVLDTGGVGIDEPFMPKYLPL